LSRARAVRREVGLFRRFGPLLGEPVSERVHAHPGSVPERQSSALSLK